jgi:hypothetical protein
MSTYPWNENQQMSLCSNAIREWLTIVNEHLIYNVDLFFNSSFYENLTKNHCCN